MKKKEWLLIAIIFLLFNSSGCGLFTPLARIPKPADFGRLWSPEKEGRVYPADYAPRLFMVWG